MGMTPQTDPTRSLVVITSHQWKVNIILFVIAKNTQTRQIAKQIYMLFSGLVDIDMEEDFVDLNDNDSPETESLNTSPQLGKRKASGRLPRPTVEPKPRRKRGNVLEESSRALASIAESSRVIAASMASDANLNALEHVKWQEILDRLKSMELNETDRLRLFSMFEADHGLAHIFMGITEDAFAKAWAYNKLYAN